MDGASGHFSADVKAASERRNISLVATPANCTDICAATDAGLGRSFKRIIKLKFRDHFMANRDKWKSGGVSLGDRRALTVKWVSEAIVEFQAVGTDQIIAAHQRCGTGLRFNGRENHLVKIDGHEGEIKFGRLYD